MLTLAGAALIAAALLSVYAIAALSRRLDAAPLVLRIAHSDLSALTAVLMLTMGLGALIQAAMLGGTATDLFLSVAALILPFAGFAVLLKAWPLPKPPAELAPANSPSPPAPTGRQMSQAA